MNLARGHGHETAEHGELWELAAHSCQRLVTFITPVWRHRPLADHGPSRQPRYSLARPAHR